MVKLQIFKSMLAMTMVHDTTITHKALDCIISIFVTGDTMNLTCNPFLENFAESGGTDYLQALLNNKTDHVKEKVTTIIRRFLFDDNGDRDVDEHYVSTLNDEMESMIKGAQKIRLD